MMRFIFDTKMCLLLVIFILNFFGVLLVLTLHASVLHFCVCVCVHVRARVKVCMCLQFLLFCVYNKTSVPCSHKYVCTYVTR